MADVNDMELLRDYSDCNSESAFAELVCRYINLVYSAALRFVDNSADAEDVTQAVFVILTRKAAGLRQRATLTGWLYETTRLTARHFLRTKARRQTREQEAYMQSLGNDSDSETVWARLEPLLEEAMGRLNEKERAVIAVHFFENKSLAEAAMLLGIGEWAARKRVERATEKLRLFFSKRGVAVPAAAMTMAISTNSVQAAPAALAKTTTAVALAKGATASTSTLTLIKGVLKVMTWTKMKTAIIVGVGILLAAGTATLTVKAVSGDGQSDLAALQGTWAGKEAGPRGGASTMVVDGANLEFHGADPNEWYKASFTLREDTTPKQLVTTITDCPFPAYKGKTSHAIYRIQDGTFTLAGNEPGNPAVPASFSGQGARVFVFKKKP
jgi:RNA polymerase sigma factor (sigma-70 family)